MELVVKRRQLDAATEEKAMVRMVVVLIFCHLSFSRVSLNQKSGNEILIAAQSWSQCADRSVNLTLLFLASQLLLCVAPGGQRNPSLRCLCGTGVSFERTLISVSRADEQKTQFDIGQRPTCPIL